MPSKLLITSKSNLWAVKESDLFIGCEIQLVESPPKHNKWKVFKGDVIGLGGGGVIDTAKLIAGDKPCFAIPTNASGAAMTSHACIWTKTKKIDVKTPVPELMEIYKNIPIELSRKNIQRTMFDCSCHILESRYSTKKNCESDHLGYMAEEKLMKYMLGGYAVHLIEAGNLAGQAIEITGTNFIHAISYVFTLDYGYCHGDALREAVNVRQRKNWKDIIDKAVQYPKYSESSLI